MFQSGGWTGNTFTKPENRIKLQEWCHAWSILFDAIKYHIVNSKRINNLFYTLQTKTTSSNSISWQNQDSYNRFNNKNFQLYTRVNTLRKKWLHDFVHGYFEKELQNEASASFRDFIKMIYLMEKKFRVPLTKANVDAMLSTQF